MQTFVAATKNGQQSYFSYLGQSKDTIAALLKDLGYESWDFITGEQFQSASMPPR